MSPFFTHIFSSLWKDRSLAKALVVLLCCFIVPRSLDLMLTQKTSKKRKDEIFLLRCSFWAFTPLAKKREVFFFWRGRFSPLIVVCFFSRHRHLPLNHSYVTLCAPSFKFFSSHKTAKALCEFGCSSFCLGFSALDSRDHFALCVSAHITLQGGKSMKILTPIACTHSFT